MAQSPTRKCQRCPNRVPSNRRVCDRCRRQRRNASRAGSRGRRGLRLTGGFGSTREVQQEPAWKVEALVMLNELALNAKPDAELAIVAADETRSREYRDTAAAIIAVRAGRDPECWPTLASLQEDLDYIHTLQALRAKKNAPAAVRHPEGVALEGAQA